jgi:hypothetical protein
MALCHKTIMSGLEVLSVSVDVASVAVDVENLILALFNGVSS